MRADPFDGLRIITARNDDGKLWVWVNDVPISFKELFEIIHGIRACERDKYGDRLPGGRDPAFMVQKFLAMCCKDGITWPELERALLLTTEDKQRARRRDA